MTHTKWEWCEPIVVHIELGEVPGSRENAIWDPVHLIVLQINGVHIGELGRASYRVRVEGIAWESKGRKVGEGAQEALRKLWDLVAFNIEFVKVYALAKWSWNSCQPIIPAIKYFINDFIVAL